MNVAELYRKNIYGIMGALIFHILLVTVFWLAELNLKVEAKKEEAILLDFTMPDKKIDVPETKENQDKKTNAEQLPNRNRNDNSNKAVNDAVKTDKFFDESYKQDIEEAQKLVTDVNKQLSKKKQTVKKIEMPEVSSEGQIRDSVKNTIYAGKSNIHYFLENRFHIRLPIPVYLAKGGGEITIDIQVDRNGNVVRAESRPSKNINDPLLPSYALQAAERTVFNTDFKAPAIQKGTITYKFVPQ